MCLGFLFPFWNQHRSQYDQHWNLSHAHDTAVLQAYQKLSVPVRLADRQSPTPGNRIASDFYRNYRVLAQRMLRHLGQCQLARSFHQQKSIRIAAIGFGMGYEIIPLLVYFQSQNINVEIVGLEIDSNAVATAKQTFSQFAGVSFSTLDVTDIPACQHICADGKFDLVVWQHPNIERDILMQRTGSATEVTKTALTASLPHLLKDGGQLYVSLFYDEEITYFKEHIAPMLKPVLGDLTILSETDQPLSHYISQKQMSPERHVICSKHGYSPQNHLNNDNEGNLAKQQR